MSEKLRLGIAAVLLLIITVFAVGQDGSLIYQEATSWQPKKIYHDPETEWGKRVRQLKADLPASDVVGYISDGEIPWISSVSQDGNEEFSLTQYFLAPIVLDRGSADHPYVVGNLSEMIDVMSVTDARFVEQFHLKALKDYGFGLFLFERIQP